MNNVSPTPKGPNLYALMENFWRESEYHRFSTAANALYFYLLKRANSRHWVMPLSLPTEVLARAIGSSRPTVIAARQVLQNSGFIRFTPGNRNKEASNYWLSLDLSNNLSNHLPNDLSNHLPNGFPIYNIKDKENKTKDSYIYKNEDRVLSLEELRATMGADEQWQRQVVAYLSSTDKIDIADLRRHLDRFFDYLLSIGVTERKEKACRTHFVNWVKKQLAGATDQNRKPSYSPGNTYGSPASRRGTEVTATSPSDYEGAF